MAITKATASGEQIVIDFCQWNPVTGEIMHTLVEMQAGFDELLALADMRLMDMNTRMLEAYAFEEDFAPAEWARFVALLDVLAGRQDAATVKHRFQAEREETAALEAGRRAQPGAVVCKECTWSSAEPDMPWCRLCMVRMRRDIGQYLDQEAA